MEIITHLPDRHLRPNFLRLHRLDDIVASAPRLHLTCPSRKQAKATLLRIPILHLAFSTCRTQVRGLRVRVEVGL